MKSRILYALPALLFAALVAATGILPNLWQPGSLHAANPVPVDTAKKGAQIKIDEDSYDFHNIEQGTKAIHDFLIQNVGTDTLVISATRPSCGCTAAVLDAPNSRIPPGGSSRLKVTFDANNKPEGPIIKSVTIISNSVTNPDAMVRIQGRVVKSLLAHKTMMHLDGIFQGNCATCHVDKGQGELGARLYEADCAVCHGNKADGKPGPDLATDAMLKHTPREWQQIISDGIPKTAMPAFATRNKGPLGDEEISSLIEYMGAYKKEVERNRVINSLGSTGAAATSSAKVKD